MSTQDTSGPSLAFSSFCLPSLCLQTLTCSGSRGPLAVGYHLLPLFPWKHETSTCLSVAQQSPSLLLVCDLTLWAPVGSSVERTLVSNTCLSRLWVAQQVLNKPSFPFPSLPTASRPPCWYQCSCSLLSPKPAAGSLPLQFCLESTPVSESRVSEGGSALQTSLRQLQNQTSQVQLLVPPCAPVWASGTLHILLVG